MVYVKVRRGTISEYSQISDHDVFTVYVCEDTQQIFIGDIEYTKSVQLISEEPTASTIGNIGCLYIHNLSRSLYLCKSYDVETGEYEWVKLILISADDELCITDDNVIKHVKKLDSAKTAGQNTSGTLSYDSTLKVPKINVNEYGHITSISDVKLTLPSAITYSIQSTESGKITLSSSDSSIEPITISVNGWDTISNKVSNLDSKLNTILWQHV